MTIMAERPAQRASGSSGAFLGVPTRRASTEWLGLIACRTADPELFYDYASSVIRERAKAICRSCPVLDQCYDEVMDQERELGDSAAQNLKYRTGVRAALTSTERWEIEFPEEAAAKREREARKRAARRSAAIAS
jgi:hypothetical protein